jgi:hypothetical protein
MSLNKKRVLSFLGLLLVVTDSSALISTDDFAYSPDSSFVGSWWGEFLDVAAGSQRIILIIKPSNNRQFSGTMYYEDYDGFFNHGVPPSAYKFMPVEFNAVSSGGLLTCNFNLRGNLYSFNFQCLRITPPYNAPEPVKTVMVGNISGIGNAVRGFGPIVLWSESQEKVQRILEDRGLLAKRENTTESQSQYPSIQPDSSFSGFWSGKLLDLVSGPTHIILNIDSCNKSPCSGEIILKRSNLNLINNYYDGGFSKYQFVANLEGGGLSGKFAYNQFLIGNRQSEFKLYSSKVMPSGTKKWKYVIEGFIGRNPVVLWRE